MVLFQISDDIFWGYRINIPLREIKDLPFSVMEQYVILKMIENLKFFLKSNHLLQLYDRVKDLHLHIHVPVHLESDEIIFLCSHCK